MKEESKLGMYSKEMKGHRLKAFQYNSQAKFPLELRAEEPGKGNKR